MTFEVGIRNAGLGLLLVFTYFDGLGGMALVAAWWGIWDIVAGLAVARSGGAPAPLPIPPRRREPARRRGMTRSWSPAATASSAPRSCAGLAEAGHEVVSADLRVARPPRSRRPSTC